MQQLLFDVFSTPNDIDDDWILDEIKESLPLIDATSVHSLDAANVNVSVYNLPKCEKFVP
jgi:hypothetical protein